MDSPEVTRSYKAKLDIDMFSVVLEKYRQEYAVPANPTNGLDIFASSEIVNKIPIDPWGKPYYFDAGLGKVAVYTLGRDGVPGGEGEDFDYSTTTLGENEYHLKIVSGKYSPIFVFPIVIIAISIVLVSYVFYRRRRKGAR